VLALLGALAVTAPASAAPPAPVPIKGGMRLVDFDVRVAQAHGYEVVRLPDGSRASVPRAKAAAARAGEYVPTSGVVPAAGAVTTYDRGEAVGDCGMSWVSLDAVGGSRANLGTGMALVPKAGDPWDVHWSIRVSDNGGQSTQGYSEQNGFIGFLTWTAYTRRLGLTRGLATAVVNWWSYTITENGWICHSYGPIAVEEIV
jgi:hypothetical protein